MATSTPNARIPERLARVPSFPPIAMKVLQLLSNPSVDLSDVLRLVSSDPTLSARILQYANSPLYGLKGQITTVRHALTMLGLEQVRGLTATAATNFYLKGKLNIEELKRCWVHTLACAVLSEELARASNAHVEEAYTAGLIHDIGRLSLVVAYPNEYVAVMREASAKCIDLIDYERQKFGLDHAEAGRWLVEHWHLPGDFAVIAGRHHDTPETNETSLLTLVHLACRLADALGFEVTVPLRPASVDEILAMLPQQARNRLPANEDQLRKLVLQRIALFDQTNPENPVALEDVALDLDDWSVPASDSDELPDLNVAPPVPATRFWPVIVLTVIALLGFLLVLRDSY